MKLQEGENVVHELRPHANLLIVWALTKCSVAALGGGVLGFFCTMLLGVVTGQTDDFDGGKAVEWRAMYAAMALAIVAASIACVYCHRLLRSHIYWITDRRCIFHGGIIRRVERSVPYHKVTDVEQSQNLIERALRICSLNIYTPGTASVSDRSLGRLGAEVRFEGLRDSEEPAESINGFLQGLRSEEDGGPRPRTIPNKTNPADG